ncbi:Oidioi.mRNA.OKI2018_I69.chr2.g6135.t1.cds [Oikopleura dioica]|uniref:Oidioi.mRNA.OKI2018_I69.chr2.g6135.t1.cds n=1 Tax=Oikopleura dioica TaxID=34765 RepID=A0ABN7T6W2_OIKDI|nr:Oidioi.mRNA.OKI2018_I69.chr2.g6135.t1.cds [Oikopleura dioica]
MVLYRNKTDATVGSCSKFFAKPFTWEQAREKCLNKGAHLASIRNDRQLEIFRQNAPRNSELWVNHRQSENSWADASNLPMSMSYEISIESRASSDECAVMDTSGNFKARDCNEKRTFFCQYEAPVRGCEAFKFTTVFRELDDFAGDYSRGKRSQKYLLPSSSSGEDLFVLSKDIESSGTDGDKEGITLEYLMPIESVIGVAEIMKRETDTFVHGLPTWTNAEARIERRASGGWNFKDQEDQILAYTEQNTFCPGDAISWTLVSTGGEISSPFSLENIPVNCIKLKTWTAGHIKISVNLKSGAEKALFEKLQFLTDDYNEQFCFSEEIESISVRNSKASGWYGMLRVFNLEGDNINYVCSENCGASTGPTNEGLMVSGGRTTQNGELWMAVANSCIMGETCILKPKWTVYDGAMCISGNDCFTTEETCSKKDLTSTTTSSTTTTTTTTSTSTAEQTTEAPTTEQTSTTTATTSTTTTTTSTSTAEQTTEAPTTEQTSTTTATTSTTTTTTSTSTADQTTIAPTTEQTSSTTTTSTSTAEQTTEAPTTEQTRTTTTTTSTTTTTTSTSTADQTTEAPTTEQTSTTTSSTTTTTTTTSTSTAEQATEAPTTEQTSTTTSSTTTTTTTTSTSTAEQATEAPTTEQTSTTTSSTTTTTTTTSTSTAEQATEAPTTEQTSTTTSSTTTTTTTTLISTADQTTEAPTTEQTSTTTSSTTTTTTTTSTSTAVQTTEAPMTEQTSTTTSTTSSTSTFQSTTAPTTQATGTSSTIGTTSSTTTVDIHTQFQYGRFILRNEVCSDIHVPSVSVSDIDLNACLEKCYKNDDEIVFNCNFVIWEHDRCSLYEFCYQREPRTDSDSSMITGEMQRQCFPDYVDSYSEDCEIYGKPITTVANGESVSVKCQEGLVNTAAKNKVSHTCVCDDSGCDLIQKQPFRCVKDEDCPMPFWFGAMSHEVVSRRRNWALINAKIQAVIDSDKGWDAKFWRKTDWTVVFVCPFDVTGASDTGRLSFDLEARYGSTSNDGKIWAFTGREGTEIRSQKKNDFQFAIDTPDGIIKWELGKNQYTCEVGIAPVDRKDLATCLFDTYGENLTKFLKTKEDKFPKLRN